MEQKKNKNIEQITNTKKIVGQKLPQKQKTLERRKNKQGSWVFMEKNETTEKSLGNKFEK